MARTYGRNSDPSTGFREAVRAVEAAACPLALPDDAAATLGNELLGLHKRKPSAAPPAPLVERTLARRFALVQALPRRDRDALTRTIDAFLTARGSRSAA